MRARTWWLIVGVTLVWTRLAAGAELGQPGEGPTVEMHGFVSQGAIKTTGNNYLVGNSKRGSVEFAEIGANFSGQLTDRLRVGLQLFSSKLGSTGNFNVKADWFNLDYRWRDWLGVRAGRVKLPFGLYNDTSDIDAARVPVLLPQSVYPLADRDFLLAQTGLELYGFVNLASAGALEYRVYGGTIYIPLTQSPGRPYQVTALSADYVGGGRLFWDTPLDGLRVGASVQSLRLSGTLSYPMTDVLPAEIVTLRLPVLLWVGSLEYAAHDWLAAVEYGRWYSKTTHNSDPARFPDFDEVDQRAYALVAYRVRRWFQPGVYYSLLIKDAEAAALGTSRTTQHDVAGTLRFDINTFWLVKLEGHLMHGIADVDPALNAGVARSAFPRDWGVFLLKTTAYF